MLYFSSLLPVIQSLFSFQGAFYTSLRSPCIALNFRLHYVRSFAYLPFPFGLPCLATYTLFGLRPVVGSSGLEPPTSRLSGVRSNHLSYEPISLCVAPLPLHSLCFCFNLASVLGSTHMFRSLQFPSDFFLVEMNRFELSTPCLQGRCSPN